MGMDLASARLEAIPLSDFGEGPRPSLIPHLIGQPQTETAIPGELHKSVISSNKKPLWLPVQLVEWEGKNLL